MSETIMGATVGGSLDVRPNLERDPFDDLLHERWRTGQITRVGVLPCGTEQGEPALVVVIRLDNGERAIGTLPYKTAEAAGRSLAAVWGER